jgi:hypothetical protein
MAEDLSEELQRNIPLSEMIQTVRRELEVALAAGRDSSMRFLANKVELELQVVVAREGGVGGKLKLGVVEANAKVGRKHTDTHVFRLELEPRWLTQDGSLVSIPIADSVTPRPKQPEVPE